MKKGKYSVEYWYNPHSPSNKTKVHVKRDKKGRIITRTCPRRRPKHRQKHHTRHKSKRR